MYSDIQFQNKQQPPKGLHREQTREEIMDTENTPVQNSEYQSSIKQSVKQAKASTFTKEGPQATIEDDELPVKNSNQEKYYNNGDSQNDQKSEHSQLIRGQREAESYADEPQPPERSEVKPINFFKQQQEADETKPRKPPKEVNQSLEYYHSDESDEAIFENQRIAQRKKQLQQEILELEKRAKQIEIKKQHSHQTKNHKTIIVQDFAQNPQFPSRNDVLNESTQSFDFFDKDDLTDGPTQQHSRDDLFTPSHAKNVEGDYTSPEFKTNDNIIEINKDPSKDITLPDNFNESNEQLLSREAYNPNQVNPLETTGNFKDMLVQDNKIQIKKSSLRNSLNPQKLGLGLKFNKVEIQKQNLNQTTDKIDKNDLKSVSGANRVSKLSLLSSKLEMAQEAGNQDLIQKTLLEIATIEEEQISAVAPEAPPIPLSYLKYHTKRGGSLGGKLMGVVETEDTQKVFFEPLSFKKLEKIICQLHPVDPETKKRFDYNARVTVDDYYQKISDMCCFYQVAQTYKLVMKQLRKMFKIKEPPTIKKPEFMKNEDDDSNDSSSSSSEEECGITQCSQSLGDGASLYLQMMKTLTIMFLILALINVPIYIMYESNTTGNKLNNYNELFKYFTIGNLGQMSKKCSFSNFEHRFSIEAEIPNENIKYDCDHGYMGEIQEFGFLYKYDKEWGGETEGEAVCNSIKDPFFNYKKPIPEPIVCNIDDFEDGDKDIEFLKCEINRKEQIGELTEEDAQAARDQLEEDNMRVLEESILHTYPREDLIWLYEEDVDEDQDTQPEKTKYNMDKDCVFKGSITSKKAQKLFKDKKSQEMFLGYFEQNCKYQQICEMDPQKIGHQVGDVVDGEVTTIQNAGLFGLISDECKLRMSHPNFVTKQEYQLTSQIYLGVFGCQNDFVKVPLSDQEVHKEVCGIMIVCFDIASILIMIFFFTKINSINEEFLDEMDNLMVQMKDFGVRIKDVRLDKFTYDSRVIKMKVWQYFKNVLQPIAEENLKNDPKYGNAMECIDVCLSLYTQPSIQCVFRMQEIQLNINDIGNKLITNQYSEEEIPDKQDELKALYDKQKRFELRYNQLTAKRVHKKDDDEQMNLVVPRVPKSQKINKVQYVFVIFKNCMTREDVLELYPKDSKMTQKVKEAFGMKTLKGEDKKMFNRELDIDPILEPDEIIWQNLSYTEEEQKARKTAVNIFSVFFVLANTLFTMYLSYFKTFMNKKIPDPMGCPDEHISKEDAFEDIKTNYDNKGLWMCYCDQATTIFLPWTLRNGFTDFQRGTDDKTNYCWRFQYLNVIKKVSLFFVSTSAVFINEYVADLYQELGKFQKKHTKNEEQQTCFRQIFIQEFINMGIIVLISSFDRIGMKAILFPDQAEGKVYQGFEPQWYMDYGKNICIFIFMSSFVVNSKDMGRWFAFAVFRCIDRKGKLNLKQDPEDEDDDKPNTEIRIQKDLETLYTGKGFKGEKAYSRMMSTMFVIQMYSSGMPILYANGFIFYLVTFCCNKVLLIYYYQKSRTLSRSIPLFTMQYLKFGLLLHMGAACLMLTNKLGFVTRVPSGLKRAFNVEEAKKNLGDDSKFEKVEDRVEFMHQQLYYIFLLVFFFTYFIGKSVFIFTKLIMQGIYRVVSISFKKFIKYTKAKAELQKKKLQEEQDKIKEKVDASIVEMIRKSQERQKETLQSSIVEMMRKSQEKRREAAQLNEQDQEDAQKEEYKDEYVKNKQNKFNLQDSKQVNQQLTLTMIQQLNQNNNQEQQENQEQQDNNQEQQDNNQENKQQNLTNSNRPSTAKLDDATSISPSEIKRQEEEEKEKKALRRKLQKQRLARKDYSDNILKEFNTENLSNFYDRCHRELTDFWDLFQNDQPITWDDLRDDNSEPFPVLIRETLYTYRIAHQECMDYQEFLKKRIEDVEKIINSHFELIIPFLHKKLVHSFEVDRNRRKKDNKEGTLKDQLAQKKYEEWFFKHSKEIQFENEKIYTPWKKMELLVEFQDELILGDKDRKDNKKGEQMICRMKGSLTQSYFIFDAQQYKVGRKIYYGIKNECEPNCDDEEHNAENDKQSSSSYSSSSSSSESSSDPEDSALKKGESRIIIKKDSKKGTSSQDKKSKNGRKLSLDQPKKKIQVAPLQQ